MDGERWFGREPALVIQAISAILVMLVGFGVPGLSDGLAAAISAVLTAGAAAWVGLHTRPVAPTVFSGLVTALATLAMSFGLHFTQQQVAVATAAISAVMVMLTRTQVTPVHDPDPSLRTGGG